MILFNGTSVLDKCNIYSATLLPPISAIYALV